MYERHDDGIRVKRGRFIAEQETLDLSNCRPHRPPKSIQNNHQVQAVQTLASFNDSIAHNSFKDNQAANSANIMPSLNNPIKSGRKSVLK